MQQRQLTTLDVFLEGARQQLSLLMDSSDKDKTESLHSKDDNS